MEKVTMTLEQWIIDAVRSLPPEKQQELLEHAARLKAENKLKKPLRSIKGLWADLGIALSAEEIDDARRDMWKKFPRDDF
jgi:hypothetical protein